MYVNALANGFSVVFSFENCLFFAHLRGLLAYATESARPHFAYINVKLARIPSSKITTEYVRLLYSAITSLKKHLRGLKFPKLDISSREIREYTDAGFASNEGYLSRLGMLVVLTDKYNKAAIIHYSSWKRGTIARSILAPEVYAVSACYDYCITFSVGIASILSKQFQLRCL